jgi:hypothetical protein
MTKDIQVLKFAVRRDGIRFGPGLEAGNILYDIPDKEADKLIAESNGTIVELPRRVAAPGNKKEKPVERMSLAELKEYMAENEIDAGDAETRAQFIAAIKNAAEAGSGSLGNIDPSNTVIK